MAIKSTVFIKTYLLIIFSLFSYQMYLVICPMYLVICPMYLVICIWLLIYIVILNVYGQRSVLIALLVFIFNVFNSYIQSISYNSSIMYYILLVLVLLYIVRVIIKKKLLNGEQAAILYMLFYIKSFTDQHIIFNMYDIFISIWLIAVFNILYI